MLNQQERNLETNQTLTVAWNSGDLEAFLRGHKPEVVLRAPGWPPVVGIDDFNAWCAELLRTFPDHCVDSNPVKASFAGDDWTCTIARCTGTMTGSMRTRVGELPPTGRRFDLDICTVSRWEDNRIAEKNVYYDLAAFMRQLRLDP